MHWLLPAWRYEEIRACVADLFEDWGVCVYPFSVWSLLRKMCITVIPYSALPKDLREELLIKIPDAYTIYPPDFNPLRTTIYYNDIGRSRRRIRFTLAHELGHLILMHLNSEDARYECEANIFANYLLAPAPLILKYSSTDYEVVEADFDLSYSCSASACDRAENRFVYGSVTWTEYEQRILDNCTLVRGGGYLARV